MSVRLKFGDLSTKAAAAEAARAERQIDRLAREMRMLIESNYRRGVTREEILGRLCPLCKRWPWEHDSSDWQCMPRRLFNLGTVSQGNTFEMLAEAATRALERPKQDRP